MKFWPSDIELRTRISYKMPNYGSIKSFFCHFFQSRCYCLIIIVFFTSHTRGASAGARMKKKTAKWQKSLFMKCTVNQQQFIASEAETLRCSCLLSIERKSKTLRFFVFDACNAIEEYCKKWNQFFLCVA